MASASCGTRRDIAGHELREAAACERLHHEQDRDQLHVLPELVRPEDARDAEIDREGEERDEEPRREHRDAVGENRGHR